MSYRVTGTLRAKGKQRKALFQNWEDAVATQSAWESERVLNGAASRPKITRLTQQELVEAEAAFAFLKDTGLTLLDVVRNALRGAASPATPAAASVNLDAARAAFLQEREPFVGKRRLESLRITISQFESFAGGGSPLATLTTADVLGWLKLKGAMSKKSWNNYACTHPRVHQCGVVGIEASRINCKSSQAAANSSAGLSAIVFTPDVNSIL